MYNIKEKILNCNIVSFDIFDTLLTRPYIEPWHLFLHIEKCLDLENFTILRKWAEKKARKETSKEDITMDDIYKHLPSTLQYVKDIETNFEETILKKNSYVFELYKFALEHKKKIILISDMYLPKRTLINALKYNDYNVFDNIYLSGEIGFTKRTGNLFEYVLKKENINPNELIHIGDNYKSDILMPQKFGINTHQVLNNKELFLNNPNNKRFKKLYKNNKNSLEISIILALLGEKYSNNEFLLDNQNYFKDFTYAICGIIGYAFVNFIIQNISEDDEVLCIARDGYNIQKIIKILKPEISTYYIYAQRILKNKLGLNENIPSNVEQNILEYKQYLISKGINFDKNIVVVDTGAASFSAQRILEKVLDKKILGIYSVVDKSKNIQKYNINCKTWVSNKNQIKCITSLIEFIFMAPELPVIDVIKGKPKYQENIHIREKELNELAITNSNELLEFVQDIKTRFKDIEIPFDVKEVNKFIEWFIYFLNKTDKKKFDSVYYSANVENTKYLPLLRKIYKLSKFRKYYINRIIYNFKIKFLKEY